MQRAAAGLAYAVIDLLGSAYGRRVLLLVGSGDNGGDALYAGAMLARRGLRASRRGCWASDAHEAGLAALMTGRRPGRRPSPDARPDVVVDGIVGIGGRPGLRPEAAKAVRLLHGVPVVAVDTPSGVDVDTGEVDGDHVVADADGHLRHPQGLPPRRPGGGRRAARCTWSTSASTCPTPAVEALQPEDVAALLPRPAGESHKYTRGVVGVRAGSAEYPGAALLSVAGAASGLAGMVRYVGDDAVAHDGPRGAPRGRRRRPRAGLGGRLGQRRGRRGHARRGAGRPRPGRRRRRRAGAPRRRGWPCRRCSPRTPASWPRCSASTARRSRPGRCTTSGRPPSSYDAVVLLKGRRTLVATPDGRVRANTTGTPLAGHRRRRRRARRRDRRAAGRRPDAVRRRLGRRVAARRGGDRWPRRTARWSRATWRTPSPRRCVPPSPRA